MKLVHEMKHNSQFYAHHSNIYNIEKIIIILYNDIGTIKYVFAYNYENIYFYNKR